MDIAGPMAQGARDDGSNSFNLAICFGQGEFCRLADILDSKFSCQRVQQRPDLDITRVKMPGMMPSPVAFGCDLDDLDIGVGAISQFLHSFLRQGDRTAQVVAVLPKQQRDHWGSLLAGESLEKPGAHLFVEQFGIQLALFILEQLQRFFTGDFASL